MPDQKTNSSADKVIAPSSADAKDIEANKYVAALGYIFILCFVPLLMAKESKFAQFHAKQAVVLFIIEVVLSVVDVVLMFVPIFGWLAIVIMWLILVIVAATAFFRTLAGEYWRIPVIADWVKGLNL